MRKDEKVAYLSEVPLFTGLSKKELGQIARHLDLVETPAGTNLTVEGEQSQQFGIIARGSAVVRRNNRKLADLGPGDFWGEMSLLLKQIATATVTTDSDASVLVMRSRDFGTLLNEVPSLSRKIATGLAARLLEADRKLSV